MRWIQKLSKRLKSDLKKLEAHLDKVVPTILGKVELAVDDAVNVGADAMIRKIDTSGTGWVGKGARATPQARVDTGFMRDSVSNEVTVKNLTVTGRMGWGVSGHAAEHYFLEQEEGFINPWTGAFVPPMLALREGGTAQQRELVVRMKRAGF